MASVSSIQPVRHAGLPRWMVRALRLCGLGVMCALSLIFAAPLLWLADVSLRPKSEIFAVPPKIFSGPITETMKSYSLSSFIHSVEQWDVGRAFFNSALITVLSIPHPHRLLPGACAHMRFPGRDIITLCLWHDDAADRYDDLRLVAETLWSQQHLQG